MSKYVTNDDMDEMTRAIFAPDSDCVHNVQPLNDLVEDIVRREVVKALTDARESFYEGGMIWRRLDDLAKAAESGGQS